MLFLNKLLKFCLTLVLGFFCLVGFCRVVFPEANWYLSPVYEKSNSNWHYDWQNIENPRILDKNKLGWSKIWHHKQKNIAKPLLEMSDKEQKVWTRYLQICPQVYCSKIAQFDTVRLGGASAQVSLLDPVYDKWLLQIHPQLNTDLDYILTHEIGHIVALNNTQIDQSQHQFFLQALSKKPNCQTYLVSEGCSFANSHINIFYQKFWKELETEQQKAQDLAESGKETNLFLKEFYEKTADYFVSDLARNNPNEDFAETFANFVLKPKTTDNKISSQKIAWMYEQPELVQIRNEMTKNLGK